MPLNPKRVLSDEWRQSHDWWTNDVHFQPLQPAHIAEAWRGPLYIAGSVLALFGIGASGVLPVEMSTDPRGYVAGGAALIVCHLVARAIDGEPMPWQPQTDAERVKRRRPDQNAPRRRSRRRAAPVRFPPAFVGETRRLVAETEPLDY